MKEKELVVLEGFMDAVVDSLWAFADDPSEKHSCEVKWALNDFRAIVNKFKKQDSCGGDL